jgi:polysaccharide export outer membrane protein
MSRSGKIRARHLCLFLITLIAFLSYQGIAACQERVGSVSSAPAAHPAQGPIPPEEVAKSPSPNPLTDLVIGEGDLLQITLYGVPDFNQHVRVESSGEVSLPMIGAVKVIGLSTEQTERMIEKELKDKGFYNNPQVNVLQQEFGGQGISVMGEVQKPGVYPVLTPRKLFDMLSAAGGTTPKAGRDILISHRTDPGKVQKLTFSSDTDKQMEANVEVFPGDTIVITKAPIVYVVGDVRLPGGFVVDKSNGLTILQALALAQGATTTAALNRSSLIHRTDEGPKETPIQLKKILEGKAKDLKLEADDILFVPHSAGKAAMQGMTTVLQTAAGAAVYRF